ncbi:phage neck terminator protein [Dickeya solani]|uniref:Phage neck terminator protein gp12-like domain-containing protein n=1 Tax=Dickeya solani TaxID=1089444 RepID=A0ABU4EH45_9GAMM|nr:hypothetical protein [Dickeya solani]MCA6999491.1 hypothetical protein [Dickeya solani]MCZ0823831.1 hypothetical protein [Dickeya solani]MDV6996221.1 hypothetical protein [Dickeya solani]MDV7005384.1 hypothetical protein [Dickeya solani]MDV7037576.1 hypothetical protein [Dickeya solani]
MSNDSTSPGYLTPVGNAPVYDEELERQVSRWIRGITGMDAKMVFPRWTDPQAAIPANGNTWCSFGITTMPRPATPANVQVSEEESEQWTWEQVTVLCCFYGPQGASMAARFREGIFVDQNSDTLRSAAGMSLIDAGTIFNLPELINNQWVRRYDITTTLSRKNIRTYNVKSIIDGNVTINTGE